MRHLRRIDWRHMLPSLKGEPGAFARWVLREPMFPRSEYAQAWELIRFSQGLAAPVALAAPPFAVSSSLDACASDCSAATNSRQRVSLTGR